jgi:hypothetical protein
LGSAPSAQELPPLVEPVPDSIVLLNQWPPAGLTLEPRPLWKKGPLGFKTKERSPVAAQAVSTGSPLRAGNSP